MSDIADVMEEGSELLDRYGGPVPPTWERNLEVLGTLMVVHKMWQAPEATVGELMGEMAIFLRAAFRMGEKCDQWSVASGQSDLEV